MSFLNAAQRAVSVIVSNDQNLADDIAQFDLIFWYFPKASTEIGGYFSIGDDYFDWGVDGVLTRIIVTCFTMRAVGNELFVCPKRNSYLNQIPAIYEAAAEWLERTGTRQELVSAIRDEARRIYTTQRCAGLDGEK